MLKSIIPILGIGSVVSGLPNARLEINQSPFFARPFDPPVFPGPGHNVTLLDSTEVESWVNPAYYASAAYCSSTSVARWNCGPACDALPEPVDIVAGGDGGLHPRYFIAIISPKHMVVSIAGTDAKNDASVSIDLDILLVSPDDDIFPGSNDEGVLLHQGFYEAFRRIRGDIGDKVQEGLKRGIKEVLVVGHSMGAVMAQMVAVYLQFIVGSKATVMAKTFAPPRSGNEKWADYVDKVLGRNNAFMINYADNVPHLPPRLWGFSQASGEIWEMEDRETYWSCQGQENEFCSISLESPAREVVLMKSFLYLMNLPEHLGPYAGVTFELFDG